MRSRESENRAMDEALANKARVIKAAKELNEVLGIDPEIDVEQSLVKIKEDVISAAQLVEPDDELSKATLRTIDELKEEQGQEEEKPDAGPAPEPEEDKPEPVKLKKPAVASAARELNKVLGLDPQIEVKGTTLEELKVLVFDASGLIEEGDEVSEKTTAVLAALKEEAGPESVVKEKPEPTPEPEPEKETTPAPPKESKKKSGEKTPLGHSIESMAGKIDLVLLDNVGKELKIDEIVEKADVTKARVKGHVKHLQQKKGEDITVSGNILVFKKKQ